MNSFLYRIAQAFLQKYGADIRKFTFVFPNRRAGLFFQKYLTELIEKPIFSPEIISVNDCFLNASSRLLADRTAELFRLYRIYRELSKSDESFDTFVFWGEMLLADFSDVDKYRVDAGDLFKNVSILKEIDYSKEYISEEQRVAIENFWRHFIPDPEKGVKKEFIAIWKILLPMYEQFKAELLAENIATEGMIFREVIDALNSNQIPAYFENKNFVFVGFNALNTSEEALFEALRKLGNADFYWDYDADELRYKDNQASKFFSKNRTKFPSKLTVERSSVSLKDKKFKLISVPSSVGQTKEVYSILNAIYPPNSDEKDWIKTAVVLPDENLLVPLLHSFPQNIENINVTMGFPLKSAPVSSLLESIFDLQRRVNSQEQFYHVAVSNILNHQYISVLCLSDVQSVLQEMVRTNAFYVKKELFGSNEILKTIFTVQREPGKFVEYLLDVLTKLNIAWQNFSEERGKHRMECDFLYQYYIAINRMNEVMKKVDTFHMSLETLVRLIRQLVGGITIPFEGEPLNGLQVMGMLETRGLDFENLIICSFNEGVFPKKSHVNSFIPNTLRRAFGLPTPDYHDAISTYNFYRMIQRTKNIYFLYDNRSEGMQTGEVSRYIHQLHYHYGVEFEKVNIAYEVNLMPEEKIELKKTPEVMAKLDAFFSKEEGSRALSASAVISYIQCPLQFYLSQVEKMRVQEEVQEKLEAGTFGTILHEVMTKIYEPYEGKFLEKTTLKSLKNNDLLIKKTISRAFGKVFFKLNADAPIELDGKNLLDSHVIMNFVQQILVIDAERAPFKYIKGEKKIVTTFPVFNASKQVNIKGFIDRLDEKEGFVRILDYKTGGDLMEFNRFDDLFLPDLEKYPKAIFQTFFYSYFYQKNENNNSIVPEILKVGDLFKSSFTTQIKDKTRGEYVVDFEYYREDFEKNLTKIMDEIFDPKVPFTQCKEVFACTYCAFNSICKRKVSEKSF